MKRFYLLILLCSTISFCASAQIGYQVSLLNNATGEPRANERVTVTVKITDSEGKTVCEEKKNERSNDFGVISMSIGDCETFTNADWSKLPFFIEATIDGRLIGKSQLLSVPVAEYAKKTGELTIELLCSKIWVQEYDGVYNKLSFEKDGTCLWESKDSGEPVRIHSCIYFIDGNDLVVCGSYGYSHEWAYLYKYNPNTKKLYHADGDMVLQ